MDTIRSLARRFQVSVGDVSVLVDQLESDGDSAFRVPSMIGSVDYYDLPLTSEAVQLIRAQMRSTIS